jgi:hypothetical protein
LNLFWCYTCWLSDRFLVLSSWWLVWTDRNSSVWVCGEIVIALILNYPIQFRRASVFKRLFWFSCMKCQVLLDTTRHCFIETMQSLTSLFCVCILKSQNDWLNALWCFCLWNPWKCAFRY